MAAASCLFLRVAVQVLIYLMTVIVLRAHSRYPIADVVEWPQAESRLGIATRMLFTVSKN